MGPSLDWRRTHTCGELRREHVGQRVVLNGWVAARRDHGGIYFVDLRDRFGLTQVVMGEAAAVRVGPEDVVAVTGEVVARSAENVNPARATGEIDVVAERVEVLSASRVPPFEVVDELDTAIETRLRYRYLDLRRPEMLARLSHRSRFIGAMRNAFLARGFVEVETPILTKATPEGARDYLVPSRVHPGQFYALPQSPQIFKQILMVAGVDRYFQVARCFRDEDLRADRQPEFTQLDMEMSFVEEEDVFETWEGVLAETFREALGRELPVPFPRLTWDEAMERFGSDKPDTRFGLELVDVAEWARESGFRVFTDTLERGGRVMGIALPGAGAWSRKEIAALEELAKTHGAKGLAWWKPAPDGGSGPLARFAGEGRAPALMQRTGASEGDLCLFVADEAGITHRVLGALRAHAGRALGLASADRFDLLWVTSFPLLEWDPERGGWASAHHPFTAPADWSLSGEPGALASRAYDLVLNGVELGSGSIRIHRQDVQERVFELLGIEPQEQRRKFGFLLDALSYGAPPHGGFALGLDRTVALSLGLESIRDVIAFPKTTSAADLMCDAPSGVAPSQLAEIHVRSVVPEGRSERPSGDGGSAEA